MVSWSAGQQTERKVCSTAFGATSPLTSVEINRRVDDSSHRPQRSQLVVVSPQPGLLCGAQRSCVAAAAPLPEDAFPPQLFQYLSRACVGKIDRFLYKNGSTRALSAPIHGRTDRQTAGRRSLGMRETPDAAVSLC